MINLTEKTTKDFQKGFEIKEWSFSIDSGFFTACNQDMRDGEEGMLFQPSKEKLEKDVNSYIESYEVEIEA